MDTDMYDKLVKHVESEIHKAKCEAVTLERQSSIITGARGALRSLLDAGAISDNYVDPVTTWLTKGGFTVLVLGGVSIVPPEYP